MLADVFLFASSVLLAAIIFAEMDRRARKRRASQRKQQVAEIVDHTWFSAVHPELDPETSREPGTIYRFEADHGDSRLEGFRPGTDTVDIDLTGAETAEIYFDTVESGSETALAFALGSDRVLTLRFPGLTKIPGRDIMITVPGVGSDTVRLLLNDISTADLHASNALAPPAERPHFESRDAA